MILAIDQGTTSSRAMLFNEDGSVVASHQLEFQQFYPAGGWVEHDPTEIWQTTLDCCRAVIKDTNARKLKAIGVSNQRETTVVWDKKTGEPIYPAIVWQDRRTATTCAELASHASMVQQKTGLLLDPYFSASKIAWILDHVPNARQQAEQGQLAFGTIETFLCWRLSKGQRHVTDITNAARTLLFNIHTQSWDSELLDLFNIPDSLLPTVLDNCAEFAIADSEWLGVEIPITACVGDQQAAAVGQACFESGMVKSTYGTGCFILLNTGQSAIQSSHKLLTTIAYRINDTISYALEGSIFNAGTAIKWLRDQLHLIHASSEAQTLASSLPDNGGVYFVPAFTGLGAPYWDPHARGALFGLTRDTSAAHIVRAALEAVAYQTYDLLHAMQEDFKQPLQILRADGGMIANDWLLQFLSNILQLPVARPCCIETSALGAAMLAGLGAGIYQSLDEIAELWQQQKQVEPAMTVVDRDALHHQWQQAISRLVNP